jgi:hypothetical protein
MHGLKRGTPSSVDESLRFAKHFVSQPTGDLAARLGLSPAQAGAWQAAVADLAASVRRRRRATLRLGPLGWVRPARHRRARAAHGH